MSLADQIERLSKIVHVIHPHEWRDTVGDILGTMLERVEALEHDTLKLSSLPVAEASDGLNVKIVPLVVEQMHPPSGIVENRHGPVPATSDEPVWSDPYPMHGEPCSSGQIRERERIKNHPVAEGYPPLGRIRVKEKQGRVRLVYWSPWMPLEECATFAAEAPLPVSPTPTTPTCTKVRCDRPATMKAYFCDDCGRGAGLGSDE